MVGILAMADTVEEYDLPCKKQRKDVEDSPTNTITSYFSPVSKSIDTTSPSPKSSNILDYFKKTQSGQHTASHSVEREGKNSAGLSVSNSKELTPKRQRSSKRVNLNNRLSASDCNEVVEISDASNLSTAELDGVRSMVGVLGSDTAALIAQLCAQSEELFEDNKDNVSIDLDTTARRKTATGIKKGIESTNYLCSNPLKKTQKKRVRRKEVGSSGQSDVESKTKQDCCNEGSVASQIVVIEDEGTHLSEENVEPTAEEASSLNNSTVTVSYEEFMKNQESTKVLAEKGAGIQSETVQDVSLRESTNLTVPQQVSPKTMTVHVQVHTNDVCTLPRTSKVKQKKIASIFLRKKMDPEDEVAEIQEAGPHSAEGSDPGPLRRSNVVIAEEELELSVLDTAEKSPVKTKCSRAERDQFMSAFRQPLTAELVKNGIKKVVRKSRGSKEGLAAPSLAAEEGSDKPSQEKENEESAHFAMSTQASKDCRVNVKDSGSMKKKKRKSRNCPQDNGKADCINVVDNEGEQADSNVKISQEYTANPKPSMHIDPATTRSNETCRITRQSLRQQRDTCVYDLTPSKPIAVDSLGTPVHVSTPKRAHWSSEENSIYKAEMLPANPNQSPFRMKFTRLSQSNSAEGVRGGDENLDFTPKSNQIYRSKNLAEAKRVVEDAKAQNKCRNNPETITPLRRSMRQQAKNDEKSPGTENLSVNLSSSTESNSSCKILNEKKPKKLTNLSDVLGKSLGAPAAKNTTDIKVASIFLTKKVVKAHPLEPITIDESSCNGSENSQDMEQFRAKRQFLMSGLPDSLKKHIAKAAAAMEIYSTAGVSFQTVVHVQQRSQASLLWDLPWPSCVILKQFQDMSGRMEGILKSSLSLGDFSEVNYTAPTAAPWVGLSNWRIEFSQNVQKCLLEEIRLSNPEFPVRKLFKPLLQKRNDHFADMLRTGSSNKMENSVIELEAEPQQALPVCANPEPLLGKRKRRVERQDQKHKRKKALESEQDLVIIRDEEYCTQELSTGSESSARNARGNDNQNCTASTRNRLNRSVKRKQQKSERETKVAEAQAMSAPLSVSKLTDQPKREQPDTSDDFIREDLLWTEKYQPQHSSELVGNLGAVRKLHSWLMEWKKRADKEETKKHKERKTEKDKKVDAWDNSDFNLESSGDEDFLCNTVLITGPPGVGKTAAVYACAQELGFKVFEVNASSQRSGRQILSQLKEATQSHQVDKQGSNALKPAFFSGSKSLPPQTARSPKKANSPRSVVTSPRKTSLSPRKRGSKKTLAPMFLANFFKAPVKSNKNEESEKADDQMSVKSQNICKAQKNNPQVLEVSKIQPGSESKDTEECNRKSATSLILFEEVDVIFDDDAGFLSAVKTFMATAKRPVILTTTDPNFSLMFECCFEEIRFKVPSSKNVASYLQLLCLAENLRTDRMDLASLLALNKCDIRQSILYLQFWVRSGGGHKVNRVLPVGGTNVVPIPAEEEPARNAVAAEGTVEGLLKSSSTVNMQDVPKCNTGCTENLLGFRNNTEPSADLFSLFKQDALTPELWWSQVQVLLEFQRRRIDFIFSSLVFLLPLPLRVSPNPKKLEEMHVKETGSSICSAVKTSPIKQSSRAKHSRKTILFDDSDLFDNDLNSSNPFLMLPNESSTPSSANQAPGSLASVVNENDSSESRFDSSVAEKKPRTLAERRCCELVSSCLRSIAEFTDSISFLDCYLSRGAIDSESSCGHSSYHWAAAEIKNGMLDERRLDPGDWWSLHSLSETRAAVEALSWNRCRSQIQHAMNSFGTKCTESGEEAVEDLVLCVPCHQNSNAVFTDLLYNHTSAASKRIDVLKTVFSNNKAFAGLSSRRASAAEYLPALRTICRAEKLKEQGKAKRRFLHYLDGVHLELPKNTLEALAKDFP
ncbi:ATPase family AAA domain-containing protein 5 isoform X2 [Hypanus sabinus]|uniref:ATPase family AAA domain-containing protein 5 isoform X2 n=1 Tax=Hypanus sabinus TaxID=79690 RepID=UPI0028C3863B|nr:ATPase family AAA domain-containing protein 5 isoform X2 [Hypanus sabinus]